MPKRALIILAEGFEEIEAVCCIDLLRRAEIDVVVAGLTDYKIKGSRKLWVIADKKLDEIEPNFDALILPGGSLGAANLASSPKVNSLIKTMFRQGKIIAAICASPAIVVAPTGILENKSATCYPGMEKHFSSATKFKSESVVVDGTIITSQGPATAIKFALAIIHKLAGEDAVEKIKKSILAN